MYLNTVFKYNVFKYCQALYNIYIYLYTYCYSIILKFYVKFNDFLKYLKLLINILANRNMSSDFTKLHIFSRLCICM